MMNPNVSRVVAMVSQTVTRITRSTISGAPATRITLLVLALLLYPSTTNAQIEWRISVKVFLDEFGQRLCLLEPADCSYDDCCYDSDEEIRDMFKGTDSTLAFLKERGITFGDIEIVELEWGSLPPVPGEHDWYFRHYCREGADDDDGPCNPDDDEPCKDSRVCVERPVEYYCDDDGQYLGPCDPYAADPCPDGGTCVQKPYRWYHAHVREGLVTRMIRDYVHEDADDGNPFSYDSEAVNFYLFPAYFGGRCDCDPWSGPNPEAILVVGHGKNRTVPTHELGHFMGLCHTHDCTCGVCGEPRCWDGEDDGDACEDHDDCRDGVCCEGPGDDNLTDTLPDSWCWEQNHIAQNNFGVDYDDATPSQQEQVDDVWCNLMSYHDYHPAPPRLTSDQLDRMMDVSGTTWFAITQRCTFFVDGDPDVPPTMTGHLNCSREGPRPNLDGDEYPDTKLDGSSVNPLSTVAGALNEAGDGDIVMVRGGYYDEQLTIDQPVFLRASKGNAVIGMTGP